MNANGTNHRGGSLAGRETLVVEFNRQLGVLAELGAVYPMYEFWWEARCGARPALVARHLPGASCQPRMVVTLGRGGTSGHPC
jgi:hypothetical protein